MPSLNSLLPMKLIRTLRKCVLGRGASAWALAAWLGWHSLAGAQTPDDSHWFYDYGGPSGDPFVMVHTDEHLYMAGGFLSVAGSSQLKNLARFNLNTEAWEQVPGIDASHAHFVRALFPDEEGNLWVAGDFSRIGGVEASRVAKLDLTTGQWSALHDPSTTTDPRGPESGGGYAVVRSGDYVYLGGYIFNSNEPAKRYIRRFHLGNQRWEAVGAGLTDRVRALAVAPNGDVFAGGAFPGGVSRWDGSRWQSVGAGVNGLVRALHVDAAGRLHVGGDFDEAGTQSASMVATWDGAEWDTLAGGLEGGGDVKGVWDLTTDGLGRLYVAGDFEASLTGKATNKVAVYAEGAWQSLGSGLGNTSSQIVNTTIAIGEDVYFGGVFADPNGSANAKKNFARWNGSEDFSNYQPASSGVVLQENARQPVVADKHWFLDYGGPSGDPFALEPLDDYLYMGGAFLSTAGNGNLKNLARFHLRYERWESVPGIDASQANFIRSLHADDKGNLWVGGDFSRIGGVDAGRVAKFDPRSNTWAPLRDANAATDKLGPTSGGVYALATSGDYVYIGGFVFNSDDPSMRFIRRFNTTTTTWESVGEGLDGAVRTLAVDVRGEVYAGGDFTGGLAKWDGASWETVSVVSGGGIRTMRFGDDGRLYVGGQFTHLDGERVNNIAVWDGTTWDALNGGVIGGGDVNGVYGIDLDRTGRVYISGDFEAADADDIPLNKVAVYGDNGRWQAMGSGLGNTTSQIANTVRVVDENAYVGGVFADPNGSPNRKKNFALWNPNTDFRDHVPSKDAPPIPGETTLPNPDDDHYFLEYGGPSGDPFAFAELGDHLYMAGGFLSVAGNGNLKNLARFHMQYERWEQVPGIDSRHANFIRSLFADHEGNLWVGGDFRSIGGINASKVAKFDPATGKWSALRDLSTRVDRLGPSSGGVYAIVRAGDYVYIGGYIFNSDDPALRYIRRFNLVNNRWEAVGEGLDNRVNALAVDALGNVYAGGGFTGGVAKWNGVSWEVVGGGLQGGARALAVGSGGQLYVGGQFDRAGDLTVSNVAMWDGAQWHAMNDGIYGGGDVNGVFDMAIDVEGRVYISGDFDAAGADSSKLNKVAVYDGGQWKALGSGLGNTTTQIVNTVVTVGEDVYFGGVFADPNGAPNRKKNFARWNASIDFSRYEAGLNAPEEEPPGPAPDVLAEANKHMFLEYGGPDGGDPFQMVRHGEHIYTAGAFQRVTNKSGIKTLARFNLVTEQWESLPGLDGRQGWVRSLDIDQEGNLWVGGDFSSIGGVNASRIAKFDTQTGQWSPLRDRNHPDEFGPVSGGAYATVRSGDYVYIGGFIFNSDDPAERFIRRFNLVTNTWETVGNGLNDRVNVLITDAEGQVYAGGSFTGSGNTPLSGLAKWDGEHWLPVGGGVDGVVRTLKFDTDGTLYVGGTFAQAGGVLANMVASWDGQQWDNLNLGLAGGGSVNGVWQLDLDSEGRLYVGGDFDESYIDGTRLNKVAVYGASGSWQPLGHGLGNSTTQIVTAVMTDGLDVYFAGLFADPNGSPNRKKNFARWNPTLDFNDYEPAQDNAPLEDASAPQRPEADKHWHYDYGGPSGDPFSMAKLGNYLYMAGAFLNTAGDPRMKNLARFNLTTLQWEPVPGVDGSHRNFIRALHADAEGKLWVGGDFSSIGGIDANRIAKFDPATGQWSALIDFTAGADMLGPVSGGVYSVVRSGDHLYIGGFVFNHNDPSMRFVRRFNVRTNQWQSCGEGLNAKVSALAVASNGDVYAGGIFTHSGDRVVQSLAKFDGSQWSEVGGGVNGVVRTMAFAPNGTLVVGGQFDQVGDQFANNVAIWNGIFWDTMDGGIIGGGSVNGVFGLSVDARNRVYIGGDFDFADSDLSRLNKAAMWDGTGTWKTMGSGLGNTTTQIVNVVLVDGNDVYMAGVFADPLGPPNRKKNFARWNETLDFSGGTTTAPPVATDRLPVAIVAAGDQLQVHFPSLPNTSYRLQVSADLMSWETVGDPIQGDGQNWYWTINRTTHADYFRVTEE